MRRVRGGAANDQCETASDEISGSSNEIRRASTRNARRMFTLTFLVTFYAYVLLHFIHANIVLPTHDRRPPEEVSLDNRRQHARMRHAAVDQRGSRAQLVGAEVLQVRRVADRAAVAGVGQLG